MRTRQNISSSTDWILIGLYAVLVILGWLNIYSAVYSEQHSYLLDMTRNHGRQLVWIASSLLIILLVMLTDPKFFNAFAYVIYAITILALIAVLLFGKEVSGSKSWLGFGNVGLQPSEFAKIGTALALSRFLGGLNVRMDSLQTRLTVALIIGLPAALTLLQHDTGSALVFLSFFLVLYREGLSGNILLFGFIAIFLFIVTLLVDKIIILIGLALLGLGTYMMMKRNKRILWVLLWMFVGSAGFVFTVDYAFHEILKEHQRSRIEVLLGQKTDLKGAGYNVHQSKIAIGSGGWVGKGFLQGTQTKYNFVPEQSTDFIFCTVGEEWGFLGSSLLLILFLWLFTRLLGQAERQRSVFSRVYGYSVASILFFHFAINIGMTIGLIPVIGIPLPYISYGGSSLWAFTLMLFVFIRLDTYRLNLL
ncbi:MAG: rod shape-determining protein RodA [Lentimicrobiaceae bacterium]|nr:rod shape-determining protein RodA [Lentimicrobiaceae bacterium]